eukprot:TRINITY_DN26378_c0_g1_i2.p2 TRINITY_DN26378_c0_g1~~TRINITY_DN26378_c0_g1_i2.p2  ORF type:complete len:138 (+),score=40.09 TRINITY_DN26378_c0_g1_i2:20-433(+)
MESLGEAAPEAATDVCIDKADKQDAVDSGDLLDKSSVEGGQAADMSTDASRAASSSSPGNLELAAAAEPVSEPTSLPESSTAPPPAASSLPRVGGRRPRPGARTRHSIREKGSTLIKLRSCRCCADDDAAAFAHSRD